MEKELLGRKSDRFLGERCYNFTKWISFPRFVESKGWAKVKKLIKDEILSFGIHESGIQLQIFKPDYSIMKRVRFIMLICFFNTFVSLHLFMFSYIRLCFALYVFSLIMFCKNASFGSSGKTSTTRKGEIEKNLETGSEQKNCENIFVEVKGENSKQNVFLISHLDTKSEFLNISQRIITLAITFYGSAVLIPFGLFVFVYTYFYGPVWYMNIAFCLLSVIVMMCAFLNVINYQANESPGSLDNGTAVSLVLETLRVFTVKKLKNINLVCLITDAEEIGVIGARRFVEKYKKRYSKDRTIVINFEGPGRKDRKFQLLKSSGFTKTSEDVNDFIVKAAKSLKIDVEVKKTWFGFWADHMPFINEGYKATMVGMASPLDSKFIHSRSDNMKNVSKEKLQEAGNIVVRTIEIIDESFK